MCSHFSFSIGWKPRLVGQDPKVRDLFAKMMAVRKLWTEQQVKDFEAQPPQKVNDSARLEDDCFEDDNGPFKRHRSKSSASLASAPSSTKLEAPDTPGIDIDLGCIDITFEQQKELDEILSQIQALEINAPESCPQWVCQTWMKVIVYSSESYK